MVINFVYSYKQTKHDSNTAYYFPYSNNLGCFFRFLSPCFRISYIYHHLKKWNMELLYFSGASYYESSVETNFPIFGIAFSYLDYCANIS